MTVSQSKSFRLFAGCRVTLAVVAVGVLASSTASAQISYDVLHVFAGGTDGARPAGPMIQATDGNLYGTTSQGGGSNEWCPDGCGTVFQMAPDGAVTVLHAFAGGTDGAYPTGLIQAADEDFYGTTIRGGGGYDWCPDGCGTVFQMAPDGTVTVLHAFAGPSDGARPSALIQATDGNFYGTTREDGASTRGTIFQMTPDGSVSVLHAFSGTGGDGWSPNTLIQASDGNLDGTTEHGGRFDAGAVFQATLDGTLTIVHSFAGGNEGELPSSLIQAADGNFYGTTGGGPSVPPCPHGCGTVFELSPDGTFTVLHAFEDRMNEGDFPRALMQASDGNLYGTTLFGGIFDRGVVFQVTHDGTIAVVHSFSGCPVDGDRPTALIQATDGNFYGTTEAGGTCTQRNGIVFRLTLN